MRRDAGESLQIVEALLSQKKLADDHQRPRVAHQTYRPRHRAGHRSDFSSPHASFASFLEVVAGRDTELPGRYDAQHIVMKGYLKPYGFPVVNFKF